MLRLLCCKWVNEQIISHVIILKFCDFFSHFNWILWHVTKMMEGQLWEKVWNFKLPTRKLNQQIPMQHEKLFKCNCSKTYTHTSIQTSYYFSIPCLPSSLSFCTFPFSLLITKIMSQLSRHVLLLLLPLSPDIRWKVDSCDYIIKKKTFEYQSKTLAGNHR